MLKPSKSVVVLITNANASLRWRSFSYWATLEAILLNSISKLPLMPLSRKMPKTATTTMTTTALKLPKIPSAIRQTYPVSARGETLPHDVGLVVKLLGTPLFAGVRRRCTDGMRTYLGA